MELYDLPDIVRKERKSLKMTQKDLSEISGLSRSRIAALEGGHIKGMTFSTVMSVLEALNLSLKIGAANSGRPLLEDVQEEMEGDHAPSLG